MEANTPVWLRPKVLLIAAGVLAVVAVGVVLYRRKRRSELSEDIDRLIQWWEEKNIKNDDLAGETKPHVELSK
ncbi:hypothetical protein IDJ77_11280 [Mucilaginibacter sp. ZT4R22]|uniref:LPXTG-motif cell wall-anchored protein n=1 Tax=Mucilaginibacter pankratovii TaxID=2772110 RepID=A0ABR7WPZ4_9SPHI|nr:hypothetical protein [Mucilaginibacter pankratovii]MBD1364391.1 hypothetical protein [Mucilaginibacter pankratovii]